MLPVTPVEGPAVGGPSSYMVSFKIDECVGLPDQGLGAPFKVRARLKGDTGPGKSTAKGWAKPSVTQATPAGLERVRKLANKGIEVSIIADVMDLELPMVEELLKDKALVSGASKQMTAEEKKAHFEKESAWIAKVQASRDERESSRNPQFEQVLRILTPSKAGDLVVELVSDPAKRPKGTTDDVVAHFEVPYGAAPTVDGPFDLVGKAGPLDGAQMYGTLDVWRLERMSGHGFA